MVPLIVDGSCRSLIEPEHGTLLNIYLFAWSLVTAISAQWFRDLRCFSQWMPMGSKGCKFISKAAIASDDSLPGGFGRLPSEPDEALTEACSCDVLNTSKGLLRGCWGKFTASAFYRPFPEDHDMIKAIRHILIALLSIEKYATREGETLENVEELGEGSFAKVLGLGRVAAKIISDMERVWVHKAAVSNSLVADREGFGPAIFGHGRVQQTLGGHFTGTVIFMERLYAFDENSFSESLSEALLQEVRKISKYGFHNDLKMPNVLRRSNGQPVVIDFDLMSQWSVKVAVSSSCIEHDFQEVLETEDQSAMFREYYDLFALSLTLENGILYRKVLDRLLYLWGHLEEPVLKRLLSTIGTEKLSELPFEVLIRVPLHGVSVCLLDLRGNLFAHLEKSCKDHIPKECLQLPQLLKSNGVYWPMEA